MRILGLITEYNPFHNGHLHHLQESKKISKSTHTVAVMSGHFLQRGEPALIHKWARAQMAVDAGVDLVLELPTLYACASAEFFSHGAVSILNQMGVVDALCFGSELGHIEALKQVATVLINSPESFEISLKKYLQEGIAFPKARSKALIDHFSLEDLSSYGMTTEKMIALLKNPNNILGIEYLKALALTKSKIQPYTITRKAAAYHSTELTLNITSATAIRNHLFNTGNLNEMIHAIPPSTYEILSTCFNKDGGPIFANDLGLTILSMIRRMTPQEIAKILDVGEGLENRIFQCANQSNRLDEFCQCVKSKRYTLTRIQRICMRILLDIQFPLMNQATHASTGLYGRILAFNDRGREIIKLAQKKSSFPFITKINQYTPPNSFTKNLLDLDIRATNLYALAVKNNAFSKGEQDHLTSPYYRKELT
ncbi:protein of unknown function DUF795 [Alkaliphilus metalliredigens QYMF]|uniref:tRNA(Met) cytidine acetate ligase n=1 Tax=Alkaliphilus metalliredigens (strain QYMF) TaxID=293826 RepID=TMCAL_ALKMQ|nr:nucleotidyltransferase [Alkaliphilus metalliredigens]A6TRU7.1 RecName: Full=tRNA(Met) cytidine acetate ligase [Alkaliphilus metalliredigens QYMF]ABR48915.1 protein of unknown function DUF795 [Alkaliphilus metalliredigens QYMF]